MEEGGLLSGSMVQRPPSSRGSPHNIKYFLDGFLDSILRLSETFSALSAQAELVYSAKIATNGLGLTVDVVDQLVAKCAVDHIEVTLDGTEAVHDRSRPWKSGKGSYAQIVRNVRDCTEYLHGAPPITIRVNVSDDNYQDISNLISSLASDCDASKLRLYFAPVHSWGNSASPGGIRVEDIAILEVLWMIEARGFGFHLSGIPQRRHHVCFASMDSSVLIDHSGKAYKCSEIPYVAAYDDEPIFRSGDLLTGVNQGRAAEVDEFYRDALEGKYGCSECKIFPICGGACPKEWAEGRVPCPTLKFNLEEKLLLGLSSFVRS